MLNLFTTAMALTIALSTATFANEAAHEAKKAEETKEVKADVKEEAAKPVEAKEEKAEGEKKDVKHHARKKHHHKAEKAPAIAEDDAVRHPLSDVQEHPEKVVNEQ